MTLIKANDLSVEFPIRAGLLRRQVGAIKALDKASFELYPSEILGIVGESGSGKTTLGRTLAGLQKPTSGTFSINGSLQMIFQDPGAALNPRHSILEAFIEPLIYFKKVKTRGEAIQKAEEIMPLIGMSPSQLTRYPHEFSLGQKQRLALGRSLMIDPQILICDEPVSALDVSVQAQILDLILSLRKRLQIAFLFITHDLSVVKAIADRIMVMHFGKIVEKGTVQEIFDHPKDPYTQKLLSAIPGKNYF